MKRDKKPIVGRWYNIRYGKIGGERSYHGIAKCLGEGDKYLAPPNTYKFRRANQPEDQNIFSYMLFSRKDIREECDPEPTYEELLSENTKLRSVLN